MPARPLLAAIAATLAIAGCSSPPANRAQVIIPTAAPVADPAPRTIPLADLTYSDLDGSDEPLILATMGDDEEVMTLTPAAAEEETNTVTWISPEGASFHFRGAQLVATDNLAGGLMSVEQDTPAMEIANTSYRRQYHHSDGNGLRVTSVACTLAAPVPEEIEILEMAYDTMRLDETCNGPGDDAILNAYWVGDDGTLWQSRQWVSADVGFLEMKRLIR